MPIEIKELVIRATIDTEKSSARKTRGFGGDEEENKINRLTRRVEELQKMMNQKNER